MLWAAVTAAFFGLLRSSEFTAPSPSAHISSTLLFRHVTISSSPTSVRLGLPASKTDQFASGAEVLLFPQPPPICPFTAVAAFHSVHPSRDGPFFTFSNGSFLTRSSIKNILSSTFPGQPSLNTHSFRIGGATALAAAGVPEYQIRVLGRWSSESFLRYTRLQHSTIQESQSTILI